MNRFALFTLTTCLTSPSFAVESYKASQLPQAPIEAPSPQAQAKAHKQVEKRKKELLKTIQNGGSPEKIGRAKARLQTDRTESNVQDQLQDEHKTSP